MNNISEHISFQEATKSEAASRKGIANVPNEEQISNMKLLAEKVFEPMRLYISNNIRKKNTPIQINSFFRSAEVNKAVGGSTTSQHCKGEAIDIECHYSDFTNKDLFLLIKGKSVFDQLIWEFGDDKQPAWVHVSFNKDNNRKQVLRAISENGKTKYIPFA